MFLKYVYACKFSCSLDAQSKWTEITGKLTFNLI